MARYINADLIKEKLQRTIINGQTAFINNVLIGLLDKAPTEDVQEVKHGKWDDNIIGFCNVCTECGAIVDRYSAIKNNSGNLNYCPNCGAKMDGDVE